MAFYYKTWSMFLWIKKKVSYKGNKMVFRNEKKPEAKQI